MKSKAAFIFVAPEVDYKEHNTVIDTPAMTLYVFGVKNYDEAEAVAVELAGQGVKAFELCAGFGNEGTARIAKAVGDKAIVGSVKFDCHPLLGHQSGDKLF